jgi:lipopolysaccharide heptosyltransferase II
MPEGLIVRLPNWLGDTVMAVPAVRALRAALPGSRILVAGPWASILVGQGLTDVVVDYPRTWPGRLSTADAVREFHGTVAVVLPNSVEAAAMARYWGAGRRIGFATDGRSWLLTDRIPLPTPRRHQIDEYLLLVEHLGAPVVTREPRLVPPPPDAEMRAEVRALLREVGGRPRGAALVVGIHLGAAYGPAKLWPAARVIELCAALVQAGAVPLLLGGEDSVSVATDIVAATAAASLAGRDRRALLPAVLTEIDVLVGGDTGVMHLAAALGTPAVTLFGPTDPALTAPRGPVEIVRHPVPCSPCFYRACPIEHPCLYGIDARTVIERVQAIAARTVRR